METNKAMKQTSRDQAAAELSFIQKLRELEEDRARRYWRHVVSWMLHRLVNAPPAERESKHVDLTRFF